MNAMRLMVVALAGWINQQQEDVIDYLREEVGVLKELQGMKRPRLKNRIIEPEFGSTEEGEVNCRERLGGLLRYYYRHAA